MFRAFPSCLWKIYNHLRGFFNWFETFIGIIISLGLLWLLIRRMGSDQGIFHQMILVLRIRKLNL